MSEEISAHLKSAAAAARPVVDGVTEGHFGDPTPCAEYDVKQLLNHLFQVVTNFQALATRASADFSSTPDRLTGDWRAEFGAETERLVAAWSAPDALEGVSAGMGLPQVVVARMALLDLTLHAWDLSRATGQDFTPAEGVLDELFALVETMGPTARERGVFGEPFEVPEGASDFARLLGAAGRDPGWNRRPIE
ncbi:TIGR03086 family metal-binding protein [Phytomonospora endophytica]|uniref:Uncharacterized protein (TIGR03086 family) n=1 Tax=Phytomonospora endophytica TaxID=714109 RepID=A0A841FM69_9ACTN|nr:TIGR03086 family metal-binding protein [Phytomonospora endophytica]MBB6038411.1 uncharacterized protein (TIGR03086 family) [Phytomonospora endophytica]GIG64341.1 TIGR03086 family protein [Phytomonospora endophytica]